MINWKHIHSVYFIGIGGIGMSALARWFHTKGYAVAGYDRTTSPLTQAMESEAISIHYEDDLALIPDSVKKDRLGSLIVYTPAIPRDHKQYKFFRQRGYCVLKRAEVLAEVTKGHFTVAVAGTHGKTTTTSIIAHILKVSGLDCTAFVGGIMTNYSSNLLVGTDHEKTLMVVEADEFDRSFLTLHPDIAVITAIDTDHMDVYTSIESLKTAFTDLINNMKQGGKLFIEERTAAKIEAHKIEGLNFETYGLRQGSVHSRALGIEDGAFSFDYQRGYKQIRNIHLSLPGYHNIENSLAAMAVSEELEIEAKALKKAIESYRGVRRRFEYIIKTRGFVFIDDYAHHPEEIRALLRSARSLFRGRRLTIVFQPHLFSRTRDFAEEFSETLSLADEVILLDIYPAREPPIEGVSSQMLLENITSPEKSICSKEALIDELKDRALSRHLQVLLTAGAGDIEALVQPIKKAFDGWS